MIIITKKNEEGKSYIEIVLSAQRFEIEFCLLVDLFDDCDDCYQILKLVISFVVGVRDFIYIHSIVLNFMLSR